MLKQIIKAILRKVNDESYNKETAQNQTKAYDNVGIRLRKTKKRVSKKKASWMYKKELRNLNVRTQQKHNRRGKSIDDL